MLGAGVMVLAERIKATVNESKADAFDKCTAKKQAEMCAQDPMFSGCATWKKCNAIAAAQPGGGYDTQLSSLPAECAQIKCPPGRSEGASGTWLGKMCSTATSFQDPCGYAQHAQYLPWLGPLGK